MESVMYFSSVLAVGTGFLFLIVELTKRRRISEKHGLWWIFVVGTFAIFGKKISGIGPGLMGFITLSGFCALTGTGLWVSVFLTKVSLQRRRFVQDLAIQRFEADQLHKRVGKEEHIDARSWAAANGGGVLPQ